MNLSRMTGKSSLHREIVGRWRIAGMKVVAIEPTLALRG